MTEVNLNNLDLVSLTIAIGCKFVKFPSNYLGLPPPCWSKSPSMRPVVERFEGKLALGKKIYLSFWWSDHPNQATLANQPVRGERGQEENPSRKLENDCCTS